jgi:hypothetical protein
MYYYVRRKIHVRRRIHVLMQRGREDIECTIM